MYVYALAAWRVQCVASGGDNSEKRCASSRVRVTRMQSDGNETRRYESGTGGSDEGKKYEGDGNCQQGMSVVEHDDKRSASATLA